MIKILDKNWRPLALCVGCFGILFTISCSPVQAQPEIKTIEVIKEVEVEKWGIQYVEVPRIIERTINVTEFREFENDEILDKWCNSHIFYDSKWDCDKYAEALQVEALKDGYLMSVALTRDGMMYGVRVTNSPGGHMGNLVMIKNEIYYIEPQLNSYHIRYVCHRD